MARIRDRSFFIITDSIWKRDRISEGLALMWDTRVGPHPSAVGDWVNCGPTVVALLKESIYKLRPEPSYPKDNLTLDELPWRPRNYNFENEEQDADRVNALFKDLEGDIPRRLVDATEYRSSAAHALREILYIEKATHIPLFRMGKLEEDWSGEAVLAALKAMKEEKLDFIDVISRHFISKIGYTMTVNVGGAVKAKLKDAGFKLGSKNRLGLGMVTTPILYMVGERMRAHVSGVGKQRWLPMVYGQGENGPYKFLLDPLPAPDADNREVQSRLMPIEGASKRNVPITIDAVEMTTRDSAPPNPYTLASLIADVEKKLRQLPGAWTIAEIKARLEYLAFTANLITRPWSTHDEYQRLSQERTRHTLDGIAASMPSLEPIVAKVRADAEAGTYSGRFGAIAPTVTKMATSEQIDTVIYDLLARRWLAQLFGPSKEAHITVKARVEGVRLLAHYQETMTAGWQTAYDFGEIVPHARLLKPGMQVPLGAKLTTPIWTQNGRRYHTQTVVHEIKEVVKLPVQAYSMGTLLEELINLGKAESDAAADPQGDDEHEAFKGPRLASDTRLLSSIQSLISDELIECDHKTGEVRPTDLGRAALAVLPFRIDPRIFMTYNNLIAKVAGNDKGLERIAAKLDEDIVEIIDHIRKARAPSGSGWRPMAEKKKSA